MIQITDLQLVPIPVKMFISRFEEEKAGHFFVRMDFDDFWNGFAIFAAFSLPFCLPFVSLIVCASEKALKKRKILEKGY